MQCRGFFCRVATKGSFLENGGISDRVRKARAGEGSVWSQEGKVPVGQWGTPENTYKLFGLLAPFVPGVFVKGHQIEHFPHAAAQAIAVFRLQFCGREVGRGMGQNLFRNKQIITAEQDFCHYVALVSKVFLGLFDAQIVETKYTCMDGHLAVFVDCFIPFTFKFKSGLAGRFDLKLLFFRKKEIYKRHQ